MGNSQSGQNILRNQGGIGGNLVASSNEASSSRKSNTNYEAIELTAIKEIKKIEFSVQNVSGKIFEILTSEDVCNECQHIERVLFIKFQSNGVFDNLSADELRKLSRQSSNKAILVYIASKSNEKFSIYWKSNEVEEFLTLLHYGEEFTERDKNIYEFIADYLAESLSKGELGLCKEWPVYSTGNEVGPHLLADSRGYNLLLIAAESGNSEVVKILVNFGANTVAGDGVCAQSLAWKNRHSDVILAMAQANLPYPEEIDINQLSDDFKAFYKTTEELHAEIIAKNGGKVKEILKQGKKLEFYFDFSNKSAARVAVDVKAFDIYEILLINELFLAPHEYQQGIFDNLEYSEQSFIRELHHKHSKHLPDKHINILMANSSLSHDVPDAVGKLRHIKEAYIYLSQDSRLNTILKVVAASKKFQIIYDFNRDAVNIADPTMPGNTEGVFYPMGRIYIGARQLLDEETRSQAVATLAHELCHFAVNLVYSNMANPYKSNDNQMLQEFEKINEKCKKKQGNEEIVDLVYERYPVDMHHAELIVRPAHIIAMYLDKPEKLAEVDQLFPELFEFFEKIIKEMEAAIPEVERREEKAVEKKDKKILKLRKKLVLSAIFSIIGIIGVAAIVASVFYKPLYSFKELSVSDKLKVVRAPIIYKKTELEFCDLFPENSIVYEELTSDHISQMLERKHLDFNDPHLHYLEEPVTHSWQNLTTKLKEKIVTSNFTFQNESLKFERLYKINSEVFNSLTSDQILDVLNDKKLFVHKMIQNETKFYVERIFRDDNIYAIYYSFMRSVDKHKLYKSYLENTTDMTIYFDNYYKEFVEKDVSTQINNLNKNKKFVGQHYGEHVDSFFKVWHDGEKKESIQLDSLSSHKNFKFGFDEILILANNSKMFILSAEAGTGKTITFEQFAIRIKKRFPTHWVSYIDLKDHKALYKEFRTLNDVKKMLEIIFGLSSENEFEKKTFEELFSSGNVILLWNGFDEISPDYSEVVMSILAFIRDNTRIIQFVCTRPLYSHQLRLRFSTQTYTLVSFDKEEQENFIRKFLVFQKTEESKIPNYIEKVQKIANSTRSDGFDTPLLLLMISELISSDVEIYESENLYEIYRKFVERKIEIWKEKSDFAKEFLGDFAFKHRQFDMLKVYQLYAMKSQFRVEWLTTVYSYFLKLKIMRTKRPNELTSDEISRMGILFINGPKNFKFAHKTFAEFFVAQYLIENIYSADDEPLDSEAELRLQVLFHSFWIPDVKRFIESFFQTKNANESKPFDPQISRQLKTKFQKFFLICLVKHRTDILPLIINFFKKDPEVLKKQLQINQDETVYTTIFEYTLLNRYKQYDPDLLKNLVRPYLTDDELDKFIHGKNQKGVILFSLYGIKSDESSWRKPFTHDCYKIDDDLLKIKNPIDAFEQIAKNLTKDEIKSFLRSQVSTAQVAYSDNSQKLTFTAKMWGFIEQYTKTEQLEILELFFDNFPKVRDKKSKVIVDYYLSKLVDYPTDEISKILSKYNVFFYKFNFWYFNIFYDFFVNHTTREQQKTFLQSEMSQSLEFYHPHNLLFHSTLVGGENSVSDVVKIYDSYFNRTEMQELMLSSSPDSLLYFIFHGVRFVELVEYIKSIFAGNEEKLKQYLLRKVELTNLNVFELLSDGFYENRIKILSNLLNL